MISKSCFAGINYQPNPEEYDSFKRYLYQSQEGLQQARVETGAQRTVQEIKRIQKAYGANEITYWEARAAIEILEESMSYRFKTNDSIIRSDEPPSMPKSTPFYNPQDDAAERIKRMK